MTTNPVPTAKHSSVPFGPGFGAFIFAVIALLAAALPDSATAEERSAIPIQAETSCVVGHRFEPGPIVGGRNRQPTVREFQARKAQLRELKQSDAHLGANC